MCLFTQTYLSKYEMNDSWGPETVDSVSSGSESVEVMEDFYQRRTTPGSGVHFFRLAPSWRCVSDTEDSERNGKGPASQKQQSRRRKSAPYHLFRNFCIVICLVLYVSTLLCVGHFQSSEFFLQKKRKAKRR